MWPVMTLTLLLQLTDDEQLYACGATGTEAVTTEEQAPAKEDETSPAAAWPEASEEEA